jgi:hypothetical protein
LEVSSRLAAFGAGQGFSGWPALAPAPTRSPAEGLHAGIQRPPGVVAQAEKG